MVHPSKSEIIDTFGTTNEDDLANFMLNHGELHGKPSISNGEPGRMKRAGEHAAGPEY